MNTEMIKKIAAQTLAALALVIGLTAAASAATFTVTRTDDRNLTCNSGVDCSLREAVAAANTAASADIINFSIAGCPGGVCTITVTAELLISSAATAGTLTITNATGAPNLLISGNNSTRVITLQSSADLTLNGVSIINARGTTFGGGIFNNSATLRITDCHLRDNTSTGIGGAILSSGAAASTTLTRSTLSNNTALISAGNGSSGGIDNSTGTLNVINSTISGNRATGAGGGNDRNGGGIDNNNGGTVTVSNSTITDNEVNNSLGGSAGGIYNRSGTITVRSSIVAGNCTRTSGAICSNGTTPDVTVDTGSTFTSQGFNFIGSAPAGIGFTNGATSDQVGNSTTPIDPMLGALANNGGTTPTHALLNGSPALDKGNSFGLTTDQRGLTRPVNLPDSTYPNAPGGDGADIGAYELQFLAPTAAQVSVGGHVVTASGRGITNVLMSLTNSNGNVRTTMTTALGYYSFSDVAAGETYIVTAMGKRFTFARSTQVINVSDETTEVNFFGNPISKLGDLR